MNALAHMSIGLVASNTGKILEMGFEDYIDKDNDVHPSLSKNSYVILKADNGNQIRTVRNMAKEKGIDYCPSSSSRVILKVPDSDTR